MPTQDSVAALSGMREPTINRKEIRDCTVELDFRRDSAVWEVSAKTRNKVHQAWAY